MDTVSTSSVLLFPLILMLFGGFVYGAAFARGLRDHALTRFRWAGVALFGFALVVGAGTLWKLFEPGNGPFYRATLVGRKVVGAHYAAFVLPLLALGAVAGLEAWFRRTSRDWR